MSETEKYKRLKEAVSLCTPSLKEDIGNMISGVERNFMAGNYDGHESTIKKCEEYLNLISIINYGEKTSGLVEKIESLKSQINEGGGKL
jgi:hypothetical protein